MSRRDRWNSELALPTWRRDKIHPLHRICPQCGAGVGYLCRVEVDGRTLRSKKPHPARRHG